MAGAVGATVSRWRSEGRALGLTQSAIDRMASAFGSPIPPNWYWPKFGRCVTTS
jgi:hypothetical protein